jgi:predicted membrane channel-forming protein YqfA (hemolysin III family)
MEASGLGIPFATFFFVVVLAVGSSFFYLTNHCLLKSMSWWRCLDSVDLLFLISSVAIPGIIGVLSGCICVVFFNSYE